MECAIQTEQTGDTGHLLATDRHARSPARLSRWLCSERLGDYQLRRDHIAAMLLLLLLLPAAQIRRPQRVIQLLEKVSCYFSSFLTPLHCSLTALLPCPIFVTYNHAKHRACSRTGEPVSVESCFNSLSAADIRVLRLPRPARLQQLRGCQQQGRTGCHRSVQVSRRGRNRIIAHCPPRVMAGTHVISASSLLHHCRCHSQATKANGFVFVSGSLGLDPKVHSAAPLSHPTLHRLSHSAPLPNSIAHSLVHPPLILCNRPASSLARMWSPRRSSRWTTWPPY